VPIPHEVLELVDRFSQNADTYRSVGYNELTLRHQFLDPFFKALGWDVHNEQGTAEAYKDVLHEEAIKVGAPDYCFRFGCVPKFFVEAKKPAVNIKEGVSPAFQLRRYAWSAKLPLSILSDFEEFAVYDCRIKPAATDSAAIGRILLLDYQQYAERWDEIASIFSREAVRTGSFDKYAEMTRGKKGTAEVDAAFLKEIESWRVDLARNLALRNPRLSQRELNFAVQRIIDRIVFLRIAEDRGIEDYEQLKKLADADKIYGQLCQLFQRADDRYNSGLFHFNKERGRAEEPDELTLALKIDDKPLKDIISSLYYPESSYEFSVFPADILGQVYEQFLGKVIRLTAGHQAKVDDKPEVKKAGGVYYTPTYIVNYIVKHTLGTLLEGKTPRQVAKLRVLDPACGSGSFLIGAYQYLLDWHRDQYVASGPKKSTKELYEGPGGGWRLTTTERKRILLNNIYGVDIDTQAVEVTKLSLLLKVLEGESQESLERQRRLFHARALPDLGNNVKCGNSVIGLNFYDNQQKNFLDDEERYRINVFDWKAEFAEIMKAGGFDAVIGNPPYVFARDEGFTEPEKRYFERRFTHQAYQLNTFALFTEQAFGLLRGGGRFGFIIPNNWLSIGTMKTFRDFVVSRTGDLEIVNNLFKVFAGASVDTSVLSFTKVAPTTVHLMESTEPGVVRSVALVNPEEILSEPIIQFRLYGHGAAKGIMKRIEACAVPLGQIALVKAGLKAYETGKGTPPQTDAMKRARVYHAKRRLNKQCRVYLEGKDVKRYRIDWSGSFLQYGDNLAAPRTPELFEGERILVRQIPSRPPYSINGAIVSRDELNDINSMIVKSTADNSLQYILGLLNSRLLTFWFDHRFDKFQRAIFPQFKVNELATFPIHAIDFSTKTERSRHEKIVVHVDEMLALQTQLAAAKLAHEKTALERQIEATDRQIDRLVYKLYGLTDEEIAIVEEATQR